MWQPASLRNPRNMPGLGRGVFQCDHWTLCRANFWDGIHCWCLCRCRCLLVLESDTCLTAKWSEDSCDSLSCHAIRKSFFQFQDRSGRCSSSLNFCPLKNTPIKKIHWFEAVDGSCLLVEAVYGCSFRVSNFNVGSERFLAKLLFPKSYGT